MKTTPTVTPLPDIDTTLDVNHTVDTTININDDIGIKDIVLPPIEVDEIPYLFDPTVLPVDIVNSTGQSFTASNHRLPNREPHDTTDDKTTLYIVDEWESTNPIKIQDGLWVSLEEHMVPVDIIKDTIMTNLEQFHPETIMKLGIDRDNIKVAKRSVTLEINY